MTANSGPWLVSSLSTPATTLTVPSGIGADWCRCAFDQDLVRCQATIAQRRDRDQSPGSVANADRSVRAGCVKDRQVGRLRSDELAARDRSNLVVGNDELREIVKPGVDRQQQTSEPLRAVGRRLPDSIERNGAGEPERAAGRSHESAEIRRATDSLSEIP